MLLRLLPLLVVLAALPAAAAACPPPREVTPEQLPAFFDELKAGTPAGCGDWILLVPMAPLPDSQPGRVRLTAEPRFPTVGPGELSVRDSDRFQSVWGGGQSYALETPRAPQRTRDEIARCKKAMRNAKQSLGEEACERQVWTLRLSLGNPNDVAVPAWLTASPSEPVTLRFNLSRPVVSERPDWSSRSIATDITGMAVTDAKGAVLAQGWSSDVENSTFAGAIWTRRPLPEDLSRNYPTRALMLNIEGRADVRCIVGHNGQLRKCALLSETPAGYEFGKAALRIAERFRIGPKTPEGPPIAGTRVTLPIVFKPADPPPPTPNGP